MSIETESVVSSMSTLVHPPLPQLERPAPVMRRAHLALTWTLAAVLVAATCYGLLAADAYRETPAREYLGATLRGQDVLTLLTAPVLVVTAHLARRGSLRAHLVWLGLLAYAAYTYLMYVVVPYNDAFLLYVAAIGLAFWALLDGAIRIDVHVVAEAAHDLPRRGIGWFLVVTGSLFALLWLVQDLRVLPGGVPEGLFVYDVPSTVHVLDLAFVLPLVVGSGVLLLRDHPAGPTLAAVMLVKMVTLGLALLAMAVGVGVGGGQVNLAEVVTWSCIALVSAGVLAVCSRGLAPLAGPWLQPRVW